MLALQRNLECRLKMVTTSVSSSVTSPDEKTSPSLNLSDVTELALSQTEALKSHLTSIIAKESGLLKEHFNSIVDDLKTKVQDLTGAVNDLKSSLEYSQKEIEDLKGIVDKQNKKISEKAKAISDLNIEFSTMKNKMTYLENQSGRNNIRINGIPEDKNESWDQTETKVKEILKNTLNLDFEPLIERAHQTGRVRNTDINKPRTIICKLYDWKVEEAILRSARAIKPTNIYVSEDFAEETARRRKELLPKLKEAREQGKIAYLVVDRLIIKNRSPDSQSRSVRSLSPQEMSRTGRGRGGNRWP